ncbi:hypothetical protein KXD40_006124 [Peronospora effusa]|uniref:SAP domain-containing protein n=1 Tax=Peronospora effusa TaxID=542832 RepID=A0A3M6VUK2_9STRA|nr:hypothetical protein DD238_000690 [Peronospora effusa]UIZ25596.1 hypothetical protein KXD40_006124 [Peronospora effusa]CAI5706772.1 unnamed protein product [Peronospora effusa]
MVEAEDERALRRELEALAKKRKTLDSTKRQGNGAANRAGIGRGSVFARLGGEVTRKGRQGLHQKEKNTRENASWRLGKRNNEDVLYGNAGKRQKLHSAVTRPEGGHYSKGVEIEKSAVSATSPTENNTCVQERKQRAMAPYAQKDGIARSRRMFGALMGHLGKAKRQIEKDTDLFKRQDTKQQEAEQREKAQSKNLEHRARLEAKTARLEALIVRTELDRSEQVARAKLEHLQMVRKSESQSKFLITIASPPIYYLPSKHTKETRELVAASMEAHEAKVKARERSHEEKLRALEAEFETKLEQLREDLKALKKNEEEESADEQVTSDKDDDTMEDGDQDMDHFSREDEEHRQENASEHGNGPSAMAAENKDATRKSVSGSEPDDSSITESRNTGGEARKNSVESKSQSTAKKERSASFQGTADGEDVSHSNAETLPHRSLDGEDVGHSHTKTLPQITADGEDVSHNDTEASPQGTLDGEDVGHIDTEALPQTTADGEDVSHSDTETLSPSRVKEKLELGQENLTQNDQPVTTGVQRGCEEAEPARDSNIATATNDDETGILTDPKESAVIDVDKMKVIELRAELKERGLDTKGLKAKLVQRLKHAMHDEDESK